MDNCIGGSGGASRAGEGDDDDTKPLKVPGSSQETRSSGISDVRFAGLPPRLNRDPAGFEAAIRDLIARAQQNDPKVFGVFSWATGSVEVQPDEPRQIFTEGPDSFTALAILSRYPDGRRRCTLSCYPEFSVEAQVSEMQMALPRHLPGDATVEHEVFIVTPGHNERQDDSWYELEANGHDQVNALMAVIHNGLPGAQLRLLPFHAMKMIGKPMGLILDIPAQADQPVRYRYPL